MVVILSLSIAVGMALGRFATQTGKLYNKSYNKVTKRRAELADYMRTVRALDETVEDLRMYAEQDACEIERLRARVKELELDIDASEADRHFHEDFYTPPEGDND